MVNFEKRIIKNKLMTFLNSIYKDSYSFFVMYEDEILFQKGKGATQVDFHWIISIENNQNCQSRIFSEISVSNEFIAKEHFLTWLHQVSTFFNSKIYTDVDIDFVPEYYYAVWCIDGTKRSVFFDDGSGHFIDSFTITIN